MTMWQTENGAERRIIATSGRTPIFRGGSRSESKKKPKRFLVLLCSCLPRSNSRAVAIISTRVDYSTVRLSLANVKCRQVGKHRKDSGTKAKGLAGWLAEKSKEWGFRCGIFSRYVHPFVLGLDSSWHSAGHHASPAASSNTELPSCPLCLRCRLVYCW